MSQIIKSFNGKTIRFREVDGYACLTDMAQACDKKYHDWFRLESTKSYLEALTTVTGIPSTTLINVVKGGISHEQGTWGHRQIALEFARWCSPAFAIQCNQWIEELMTKGKVEIVPQKPKSAIELVQSQLATLTQIVNISVEHEQRLLQIEEENKRLAETQDEIDTILTTTLETIEETRDRLESIEVEQDRYQTPSGHKYTVLGYAKLQGLELSNAQASAKGKQAARLCRQRDIAVEKIHDPRYGYVGLYPESLLREVFAR